MLKTIYKNLKKLRNITKMKYTDKELQGISNARQGLYRMCKLIVSECECQSFTWQNGNPFLPLRCLYWVRITQMCNPCLYVRLINHHYVRKQFYIHQRSSNQ